MNDQITLDHPSCHPVKGWFRATGEWEASDDVLIHLVATGRGNGIGIDWDYDAWSVDIADTATATRFSDGTFGGIDWTNSDGEPSDLRFMATLWMLGVAYCWAMKSAEDWANKNAEGLAQ
jgi:hypothetical protein